MAFGLVHSSAGRSTSRHGHTQASARLLNRLALVLVLRFIVWKWLNSVHSLDSNQDCGIDFGNSSGSLSHFGILKETWKPQIFIGCTSFKSSRGTNLLVLIILAGDIEMNPGPRSHCRRCKQYCKATYKVIKCEECRKCFHASCANLSEKVLLE